MIINSKPIIFTLLLLSQALSFTPITTRPRRIISSAIKMSEEPTQLEPINPSETAFVFIEYQNEFTTEGGKLHDAVKECMESTNMLENSIAAAKAAREAGCTVIHMPIDFEPGHNEISKTPFGVLSGIKDGGCFTAGTWGAELCDSMKPQLNDLVAKGKSGLCGFESTNLDFLLRQKGCNNIVLAGFLTNCCVESSMRTAYEKGYKVYTLTDCTAATSIEAKDATIKHNFGLFSIPTTSTNVITALTTTTKTPVTA